MALIGRDRSLLEVDERELILRAKTGEELALEEIFLRYRGLILKKVEKFLYVGFDKDDLLQEAFLALFTAIRSYNIDFNVPFSAYAGICISNKLISVYRSNRSSKKIPAKLIVSLNSKIPIEGIENLNLDCNPESFFIKKEDFRRIESVAKKLLTRLEFNILTLFVQNKSYVEIAKKLKINKKAVDNALQRIRKKLKGLKF